MVNFSPEQKAVAVSFAQALADRDYATARALCSRDCREQWSTDVLQREFEAIVPLDWGDIDPIEIVGDGQFPFIYVSLGGDVYSEAIIIGSYVEEDGQAKIGSFQLGRP